MGELAAELNRLAGTTGYDAQKAANVLAGTTNQDIVGALNTAAGTTGKELNGALKALAAAWGGNALLDGNAALVGSTAGVIPTAPDAPTIGTAVAGNGQVIVAWTAPASDGGSPITAYEIKTYSSSGTLLATDTQAV